MATEPDTLKQDYLLAAILLLHTRKTRHSNELCAIRFWLGIAKFFAQMAIIQ